MQRYAGLGIERYCWREGSVIDDLRYVHGFGIERNSSVRGVQIQSIRQRSRALTFRFSWGGEFGGGPASAGPPPKFPGPSVVMFPTFYGHSRTLSGQTHLFVSQNRVGDGRLRAQSRPKPASQKFFGVGRAVAEVPVHPLIAQLHSSTAPQHSSTAPQLRVYPHPGGCRKA